MFKMRRHIILLFVLLHGSVLLWSQQDEYSDTTEIAPPEVIDESRTTFSIITEKNPVEIKKLSQDKVDELKQSDDYWYANIEREKEPEEKTGNTGDSLFAQQWFQTLLWIIILCSFIGVVIWYLASSNINLFRKESKKINEEEIEDEWTDDIFNINYEKEIQKAASLQNYRLAVRLLYLRTLKDLSERNIIDYRFGKTNNDYVTALFGSRYHRDFFKLTRSFEYTWYGQFKPSAEAYEMMQADFVKFKNTMA